ncbi:MAG TPA: tetratricopeptide repeat protein [Blastocatellia bacterium]
MFRSQLISYRLATAARAMLVIAICAVAACAQSGGIDPDPGDPGTGGKNSIQGRIFVRGGGRLAQRAKVKLLSLASGEQFLMSDDSGAFMFRRLRGGTYTVVVEAGEQFEKATETVDIIEPMRRKDDSGVNISVTIYVEPKRSPSNGTVGTIDASAGLVPDAAKDLYKQAVESAKSGDRKKAIDELKEALAIYPNFMTALNELGVQYIALKQFKEAAEALRTAIKIAPEAFHPRLNYGIVLVNLKNYKDAATQLQIAVQKDSSSATAHFYFGRALVSLGSYDAAEKALRQTISIGGEEATEAHRYLGAVYIEKHDSPRAADELEQYLKLAPKAKDADKIRVIIKDLRAQASAK